MNILFFLGMIFPFFYIQETLFSQETPISVTWEGSFMDLHSMSFVNRSLITELSQKPEIRLTCIESISPHSSNNWPEFQNISKYLHSQPISDTKITVRQSWKANWNAPIQGLWVLIQPWDYGAIPQAWIEPLKKVDEIWVPSHFIKQEYIDSGVAKEKIVVIPNGIDPLIFRPKVPPLKLPTNKTYKFLFVGELCYRKGFDLLLKTYLKTFTAKHDVCLVVKTLSSYMQNAEQSIKDLIKESQCMPDGPEIIYLDEDIPLMQMPGIYTACDCLVHPYRGEGFGLPILEAMACGLPVIVTDYGGPSDFVREEFAWLIPSRVYSIGKEVYGIPLAKDGWLREPDEAILSQQMSFAMEHRLAGKRKGRLASVFAREQWTWKKAAEAAIKRLKELVGKIELDADS